MNSRTAARQGFLPLMRELVRTYQAFASYDAAGYQESGLTVPQADVIFSLGNTDGMTLGEIGDRTLITKGTLTGIVDRLEDKGLVVREACDDDRRCTLARLTRKGERVFEDEFPRQIRYLKKRFDRLSTAEQKTALRSLQKLRAIF